MGEDVLDIDQDEWPDCAIDGCEYKCCLALESVYCFRHTPGSDAVKHIKIDARNSLYSFPSDD